MARARPDIPERPRPGRVAPRLTTDLPVTGAWRPGDPVGNRRFVTLGADHAFGLEGGGALAGVDVAYETWGELSDSGDNAVLVCHALTGDSHVAGDMGSGHPTAGWWGDMVGPGRPLDTDRHLVVCVNVLGGCQGTVGPATPDPATGRPFGSSFPTVTIRDMVRAQAKVADVLGVRRWKLVIGGSMGGMQALEWAVMYPDRVAAIAPLASTLAASPWQIGFSAVGRAAIALDPNWRDGDYYDAAPGEGPAKGLAIARSVAQITYRSDEVFTERFGREVVDPSHLYGLWDSFQVESYLDYHGEKLVRRFDANSYLVLNRAMDLHDLGRGRGGLGRAVARIRADVLSLAISSDTLYPPHQQSDIAEAVRAAGGNCTFEVVDSPHGHDGFLLETEAVGAAVTAQLDRVENR